jgi:hypothetical protein
MIPNCQFCQRPMQLNTAVTLPTVTQYLCGCRGEVTYKNEPRWAPPLELKGRRKA